MMLLYVTAVALYWNQWDCKCRESDVSKIMKNAVIVVDQFSAEDDHETTMRLFSSYTMGIGTLPDINAQARGPLGLKANAVHLWKAEHK